MITHNKLHAALCTLLMTTTVAFAADTTIAEKDIKQAAYNNELTLIPDASATEPIQLPARNKVIKGYAMQLVMGCHLKPEMSWEYDQRGRFAHFYKTLAPHTYLIQTLCSDSQEALYAMNARVAQGPEVMFPKLRTSPGKEKIQEWCRQGRELDKLNWYRGGNPALPGYCENGPTNFPCYLPKALFDTTETAEFEFNGYTIQLTRTLPQARLFHLIDHPHLKTVEVTVGGSQPKKDSDLISVQMKMPQEKPVEQPTQQAVVPHVPPQNFEAIEQEHKVAAQEHKAHSNYVAVKDPDVIA